MRHSTFYIHRTRTWKWAKSRYSWKARARRPPAPAQPTRCTTAPGRPPQYGVTCEVFPREPTSRPTLLPPTHAPRGWASPRLSQDQGCQPQRAGGPARAPGHPPAPPRRHDPRGPGAGPGGHPHPPLRGSAHAPSPPPGARGAGRGACFPANTGGHRRYGGPPCAAPPGIARRPPGAQRPEPHPKLGAVARRVGQMARPPPSPVPMDGHIPLPTRNQPHCHPPPPLPPSPRAALHGTARGTPLMH